MVRERALEWARFGWTVFHAYSVDRCGFLAAGLCYFVFFSLFPFLLLVVAILSYFLSAAEASAQAADLIGQIFPQQADFLVGVLGSVLTHRGEASLVGIVTLIWSSKNIFLTLGQALNVIWKVPADRGVIKENALAIVLSVSVGLLALLSSISYAILMAVVNFRIPFLGLAPSQMPGIVFLIANILPATLVTLVLMGLYLILPNCRLAWTQVFPGALVASLAWEALRRLFAFYLAHMARLEVFYGSVSGIVGFLLWIFISANLFLAGAELCWVLDRFRRQIPLEKLPLEEWLNQNWRRA